MSKENNWKNKTQKETLAEPWADCIKSPN